MEFNEAKERMETALREIQKDGESTVVGREDGCVIVRSREEEVALWPTDFVEEGSDEIGDPHAEETPNELPGPGQKSEGDSGDSTPSGATTGDAGAQQSADEAQKAAAEKAAAAKSPSGGSQPGSSGSKK